MADGKMLALAFVAPFLDCESRHAMGLASKASLEALSELPWSPGERSVSATCKACKSADTLVVTEAVHHRLLQQHTFTGRVVLPNGHTFTGLRRLSLTIGWRALGCGEHLATLTQLTELDISECQLGERDCEAIGSMTNLRSLDIRRTMMTSGHCAGLHLQTLKLMNVQPEDLRVLTSLTELTVEGTFGGAHRAVLDRASLQALTNLRTLRVHRMRWGASDRRWDVDVFSGCTALHTLDLKNSCQLADLYLAHVPQSVKSLDIRGCWQTTSEGLQHVTQLETLYWGVNWHHGYLDDVVHPLVNLRTLVLSGNVGGATTHGFHAALDRLPHLRRIVDDGVPSAMRVFIAQWNWARMRAADREKCTKRQKMV